MSRTRKRRLRRHLTGHISAFTMSTPPAFNMVFFSALADGHGERRRGDRIATVFARLHMLPSDTLSSNWRRCRKSDAFGGKSHFWCHPSSDIHRS
jgi:hypothetical protein